MVQSLRWGDYPGPSTQAPILLRESLKVRPFPGFGWKEVCEDRESERGSVVGFEDGGEGPRAKEGRFTSFTHHCILPWNLWTKMEPFLHLDFSPERLLPNLSPTEFKTINDII